MPNGYTGQILRVNLSNNSISVENPDDKFYRRYVGGATFIAYSLLKELKPRTDPLGPDNKLIFAAGPVTGTPLPGAARNCVGAKSPRSGAYAKAEVGGFFGTELKRAGYDAVIVEGKAERPVYLWIHDGEAEIRDASQLWGKTTKESQEAIRAELGDRLIRTAQIGPAGERLVSIASITNDLIASAARTGLGAVMGSKNLKAVAVRGHKAPQMVDPAVVSTIGKWVRDNARTPGMFASAYIGTGRDMTGGRNTGNLPTNNFRDGDFPNVEAISAQAIKDTGLAIRYDSCFACPLHCKKIVEVKEGPYTIDPAYGGPEYETLAAFGSHCGIGDLKAICKAHEICNAYSLDTISTGVAIAFGMECFENNILTREDTGGIKLTFGNTEAMLQVVELIGKREGIGALLGEGTRKAAERLGKGAERFAMHVKGIEIPMHEPRLKHGLGLTYSITAHGADHMESIQDTQYEKEGPQFDAIKTWGFLNPLPLKDLGPRKVALAHIGHLWRLYMDSLVMCMFVRLPEHQIAEAVRAITGWNTSTTEALKVGERAATIARAFNIREGLSHADDQLPPRFFQPATRGPLKETAIDPAAMDKAIHSFYRRMGWDAETGMPTAEKLEELEIDWVVEELAKAGIKAP